MLPTNNISNINNNPFNNLHSNNVNNNLNSTPSTATSQSIATVSVSSGSSGSNTSVSSSSGSVGNGLVSLPSLSLFGQQTSSTSTTQQTNKEMFSSNNNQLPPLPSITSQLSNDSLNISNNQIATISPGNKPPLHNMTSTLVFSPSNPNQSVTNKTSNTGGNTSGNTMDTVTIIQNLWQGRQGRPSKKAKEQRQLFLNQQNDNPSTTNVSGVSLTTTPTADKNRVINSNLNSLGEISPQRMTKVDGIVVSPNKGNNNRSTFTKLTNQLQIEKIIDIYNYPILITSINGDIKSYNKICSSLEIQQFNEYYILHKLNTNQLLTIEFFDGNFIYSYKYISNEDNNIYFIIVISQRIELEENIHQDIFLTLEKLQNNPNISYNNYFNNIQRETLLFHSMFNQSNTMHFIVHVETNQVLYKNHSFQQLFKRQVENNKINNNATTTTTSGITTRLSTENNENYYYPSLYSVLYLLLSNLERQHFPNFLEEFSHQLKLLKCGEITLLKIQFSKYYSLEGFLIYYNKYIDFILINNYYLN
ncbi:hypothetical protein ABK040_011077 [Willaertia magna]